MNKWINNHRKKILAIFSIGLMISFVATTGYGRGAGDRRDSVAATIGGNDVKLSELQVSRQEWALLKQYAVVMDPTTGQGISILLSRLGVIPPRPPYDANVQAQSFERQYLMDAARKQAASIVGAIGNGDTFFQLVKEAKDAGVVPNERDVAEDWEYTQTNLPAGDDQTAEMYRSALGSLEMIRQNFQRVTGSLKVSSPQTRRLLATETQSLVVSIVPVLASEFMSKIPDPSSDQQKDQFQRFVNVDPGHPDAQSNPFGFGYRLPERVKLQYVQLTRSGAEAAIAAQKSTYDWDVEGRKYYLSHADDFPTTQPASSTSKPSVKLYDQVRDEAIAKVRDPMVEKLMLDVQGKIVSTMQADFRGYQSNPSATTSLGENYPSYTYLRKLSESIQTQFKVKPEVFDEAQRYLSEKDLAALPGIGQADNRRQQFATLAMLKATEVLSASSTTAPAAPSKLMEPSFPLQNSSGNIYVFRLSDARPAEAPATIAEVSTQVQYDLKLAAGYKLATGIANSILNGAKAVTLATAAATAGRNAITSYPISGSGGPVAQGVELTTQEGFQFKQQVQKLLETYNPNSNPRPSELVELPTTGKLFVVQLISIMGSTAETDTFASTAYFAAKQRSLLQMQFAHEWYDPSAIASRTGFEMKKKSDE